METDERNGQGCVSGTHAQLCPCASPVDPRVPSAHCVRTMPRSEWLTPGRGWWKCGEMLALSPRVSGDGRQINLPPVTAPPHKIQFLSSLRTDGAQPSRHLSYFFLFFFFEVIWQVMLIFDQILMAQTHCYLTSCWQNNATMWWINK